MWVKTEFNREDLDGQTVEFSLKSDGLVINGIGVFRVLENPEMLLWIDICVDVGGDTHSIRETCYNLSQDEAAFLRVHPDPEMGRYLVDTLGMTPY